MARFSIKPFIIFFDITYMDECVVLFPGEEKIEIKKPEPMLSVSSDDDSINEKYIQGQVRIVTEQARYPLDTICKMVDTGRYILRPEFQRRHRWNREKQSRLIESFIMNVPIPPIFLYEKDYACYEVMDGLQRLTAIIEFYKNLYALEGLEFWPELNGKRYSELPKAIKQGIDRRHLSSIILLNETASSVEEANRLKQLVFSRINSGGAKLEYQESRNALFGGPFNSTAIKLSRNDKFCLLFDIPQRTDDEDLDRDIISPELSENAMFRQMADVEMIVRFFSMRFIDSFEGITLREFMDQFTAQANALPQTVLDSYCLLFDETIGLVFDVYGSAAFCLWKYHERTREWRRGQTPAKILYDPIMYVTSQFVSYADCLRANAAEIRLKTDEMIKSHISDFNGRKSSKNDIKKRIELFQGLFSDYVQ